MRLRSVESRSRRSVSGMGEGRGVADMAIPLDIDPLLDDAHAPPCQQSSRSLIARS
jgi:hypothetical protein